MIDDWWLVIGGIAEGSEEPEVIEEPEVSKIPEIPEAPEGTDGGSGLFRGTIEE
jgi:hypothetical protein